MWAMATQDPDEMASQKRFLYVYTKHSHKLDRHMHEALLSEGACKGMLVIVQETLKPRTGG